MQEHVYLYVLMQMSYMGAALLATAVLKAFFGSKQALSEKAGVSNRSQKGVSTIECCIEPAVIY